MSKKKSLPTNLPPYQRNMGVVGGNKPRVTVPARTSPAKPYKPKPKRWDYLNDPQQKPVVQFAINAMDRIKWLVDDCSGELGWTGAVERVNKKLFIVHAIRVMEQNAGPSTFKYDHWNDAVTDMIQRGELTPGRYDAILGHSHVNMGVSPSGTDEEQMMDLLSLDDNDQPKKNPDGSFKTPFSIQTIHNKRGEVWCAVYDWENEEYHGNCPVEIASSLTEEDIADLKEQVKRVKPYVYSGGYHWGNMQGNAYGRYGYGGQKPATSTRSPYQSSLFPDCDTKEWGAEEWLLWDLDWDEDSISDGSAAKAQAKIDAYEKLDSGAIEV